MLRSALHEINRLQDEGTFFDKLTFEEVKHVNGHKDINHSLHCCFFF